MDIAFREVTLKPVKCYPLSFYYFLPFYIEVSLDSEKLQNSSAWLTYPSSNFPGH